MARHNCHAADARAKLTGVSLTSELENPESRFSVFMDQELPGIGSFVAQIAPGLPAILARTERGHNQANSWQMIGTAIDYRLRLAFAADAVARSSAFAAGMMCARTHAGREDDPDGEAYRQIADLGNDMLLRLESMTRANDPSDRNRPLVMGSTVEEDLCRLCYMAAWYDALGRTGDLRDGRTGVLSFIAVYSSVLDDMLDSVPHAAVANMLELLRYAARSELGELRAKARAAVPGPCFAGSVDVNGADADLIVDDLLLEIKTHRNPANHLRESLRQLLGYMLLDYDDSHRIRRVGLYYTRHAHLSRWDAGNLIRALGAESGLAELRRRCADALSQREPGRASY